MKRSRNFFRKHLHSSVVFTTALILICIGATGCAFVSTAKNTANVTNTINTQKVVTVGNKNETEVIQKVTVQNTTAQKVKLYEEAIKNKVCISVKPSVIREPFCYYIPSGKKQEKLLSLMKDIKSAWKKAALKKSVPRFVGMKETGWDIAYDSIEYMALEGGFLSAYDYDTGVELFIRQKKLCNTIQRMLEKDINYTQTDISEIKDIVSAKLDITGVRTGGKLYSQTITDKKTLKLFEKWFKNAEYVLGGSGHCEEQSCLELKLATGKTVKLSMAADSCTLFGINGVYYDYRSKKDKKSSCMYSDDFFKHFDKIPMKNL